MSPDLLISDATLTRHDTQILLDTGPQIAGTVYTVTVSDVVDKAGNGIVQNSAQFTAGTALDDGRPRVVGAASTSNTTVLVTFSKRMGPSAEVAGNYIIVQENVNAEVGAIGILNAAFLSPQQDAVELTTTQQSEVTYFLSVVNVLDISGNQLAPPELLVDPATAIFAGTPVLLRRHGPL